MKSNIDINADVGEGRGNEPAIMPYLGSCNIACGGHAGDIETMDGTVELAMANGVKIGAHPSFPDRENFGRVEMSLSNEELLSSLKDQMEVFLKVLKSRSAELNHIKAHGALYNMAVNNKRIAKTIIDLIHHFGLKTTLYVPYGSVIAHLATLQNINIKFECFADRNYNEDLSLVSRKNKNAVIENEVEILNHCRRMIDNNEVKTIGGKLVKIKVETLCVHGDNPNAKNILKYLQENL